MFSFQRSRNQKICFVVPAYRIFLWFGQLDVGSCEPGDFAFIQWELSRMVFYADVLSS